MSGQLTLMAVHAHPDDEAGSTGGVLARYAREGVRTVVVTMTDGAMGDGHGGVKPGTDGHDESAVVATRRRELEVACELLGVGHLERLDYRDSGMAGWPGNAEPNAFCNVSVAVAAARVADLIEQYRPQVVITYDEDGGYGHPDHVQAHRVAVAAAGMTGIPQKVYFTAISRTTIAQVLDELEVASAESAEQNGGLERPRIGVPDEVITTAVDTRAVADVKRAALEAHASQLDNAVLLQLPPTIAEPFFARETFIRAVDRTDTPLPEDDLFAGLR